MRRDLGRLTLNVPCPVYIIGSYDEENRANAMNAAYGGIYDDHKLLICLDTSHKTYSNIKKRGDFTVSFADKVNTIRADYLGLVSANDTPDKVERAGLTVLKSLAIDAPCFAELPLALECRVLRELEPGIFVSEILAVNADDSILKAGKLDSDLFEPIIYDMISHYYRVCGERVNRAFACGKELI